MAEVEKSSFDQTLGDTQQPGLAIAMPAPIDRNGFQAEIDGREMGTGGAAGLAQDRASCDGLKSGILRPPDGGFRSRPGLLAAQKALPKAVINNEVLSTVCNEPVASSLPFFEPML